MHVRGQPSAFELLMHKHLSSLLCVHARAYVHATLPVQVQMRKSAAQWLAAALPSAFGPLHARVPAHSSPLYIQMKMY